MTQNSQPAAERRRPHFTGLWMQALEEIADWAANDDFLVAPNMVLFLGDDMMLLFTLDVPEEDDPNDPEGMATGYSKYTYDIRDGMIHIADLDSEKDEIGDGVWGILPFAYVETGGFKLGLSERLCSMRPANIGHARDMGFAVEFIEAWQHVGDEIEKPFDPGHSYPMGLKSEA